MKKYVVFLKYVNKGLRVSVQQKCDYLMLVTLDNV